MTVSFFLGYAYIANPNKVNYTESYVVFCKDIPNTFPKLSRGIWTANPRFPAEGTTDTTEWVADAKLGTDMTWAGSLFYAPTPAGHTGFYKEGISNVSTSDIVTSGFTFYGMTAMLEIDGQLYTEWYAVPTPIDGLWSVSWNTTDTFDTSEAEPITVRKVYPPNVDYPDV